MTFCRERDKSPSWRLLVIRCLSKFLIGVAVIQHKFISIVKGILEGGQLSLNSLGSMVLAGGLGPSHTYGFNQAFQVYESNLELNLRFMVDTNVVSCEKLRIFSAFWLTSGGLLLDRTASRQIPASRNQNFALPGQRFCSDVCLQAYEFSMSAMLLSTLLLLMHQKVNGRKYL